MPAEGLAGAQKILPRAPEDHPERRAAFDEGGRHRGHHDVGEEPAALMPTTRITWERTTSYDISTLYMQAIDTAKDLEAQIECPFNFVIISSP